MGDNQVAAIQAQLGYSDADIVILKAVKRIWDKLEGLRRQAVKDERYLQAYRDLLEKSLRQARLTVPPTDVETVIAEAAELWRWYDSECVRLKVADLEQARGLAHLDWCAKWLATQYQAFDAAVGRMVECPAPQQIADVKRTATAMLQAYVSAI